MWRGDIFFFRVRKSISNFWKIKSKIKWKIEWKKSVKAQNIENLKNFFTYLALQPRMCGVRMSVDWIVMQLFANSKRRSRS